jgi:YggT family protein
MPRLVRAGDRAIVRPARGPGAPPGKETQIWLLRMHAILNLLNTVISIYIWLLIASVMLSWLIAFNVISTGNRFVYEIRDFLYRITEPLLRPIRNLLPNLGGIDISPVVLILGLVFLQNLITHDLAPALLRP